MKNIVFGLGMLLSLLFASCNKELATPYDHPFFYIHVKKASEVQVQTARNETVEYPVYFSTKQQYEAITLDYEVIVGDGLKAGVDFELLNTGTSLVFKPGFVEMPIRIRWISHAVDPAKDNTIRIKLLKNDKQITIGLPGPDANQSELKIIKI
ncbi:hypothetical protein [Sphingobacterium sp. MYb382]|uniref:hypothetical protein n=1 Tax=Sphingobacterium sp. MYb382 TaxID=2745278 RepID=UPI0030B6C7FF